MKSAEEALRRRTVQYSAVGKDGFSSLLCLCGVRVDRRIPVQVPDALEGVFDRLGVKERQDKRIAVGRDYEIWIVFYDNSCCLFEYLGLAALNPNFFFLILRGNRGERDRFELRVHLRYAIGDRDFERESFEFRRFVIVRGH